MFHDLFISDKTLNDDLSTSELAASINAGTDTDLSGVLRIVAGRLAARADKVTDPRSVLFDLGHVLESLHATIRVVLDEYDLAPAGYWDVLAELETVIGTLTGISSNL